MIVYRWGVVEYKKAMKEMREIHSFVQKDKKNRLIVCSHPKVFTVGSDRKKEWGVDTIYTDRGGSVTCHSEGQSIFYFCFVVEYPFVFYKKVREVFSNFFSRLNKNIYFDKKNPGFYIENRKISSLGFRYENGVSLHGVSVNVDVDLSFHSLVPPCGLEGIKPGSLVNEGILISQREVEEEILKEICEVFGESLQT